MMKTQKTEAPHDPKGQQDKTKKIDKDKKQKRLTTQRGEISMCQRVTPRDQQKQKRNHECETTTSSNRSQY